MNTPTISPLYGAYAGWSGRAITTGSESKMRFLWCKDDGTMALWTPGTSGSIENNLRYGPH